MKKLAISILTCLVLLIPSGCDIFKKFITNPENDVNCSGLEVAHPIVFEAILEHLLTNETVIEGDWQGDFGDATCYAPPVLLAHGNASCDSTEIELAFETIDREYNLIANFLFNSSEALIGGLGLTEVYEISKDERVDQETRSLLTTIDAFMRQLNITGLLPKFMSQGYGQTAATALVAALQLQYFIKVDPSDNVRKNRALEMVNNIEAAAYDTTGFYIYEEGNKELYLYPNVAMMMVHSLAYRISDDVHHLEIAESLFTAIEPLYVSEIDAYRSPYQGSGVFVSFSSQNYLALALIYLYNETGNHIYLDKAKRTVDFIINRLYSDGIVYHDLKNYQRADWYCTGCNFQFLFILWKMEDYLEMK